MNIASINRVIQGLLPSLFIHYYNIFPFNPVIEFLIKRSHFLSFTFSLSLSLYHFSLSLSLYHFFSITFSLSFFLYHFLSITFFFLFFFFFSLSLSLSLSLFLSLSSSLFPSLDQIYAWLFYKLLHSCKHSCLWELLIIYDVVTLFLILKHSAFLLSISLRRFHQGVESVRVLSAIEKRSR